MTKKSVASSLQSAAQKGNCRVPSARAQAEGHVCHQDCNGHKGCPDFQRSRGKLIKMTEYQLSMKLTVQPMQVTPLVNTLHTNSLPLGTDKPEQQEPTNSMIQDCSLLHTQQKEEPSPPEEPSSQNHAPVRPAPIPPHLPKPP